MLAKPYLQTTKNSITESWEPVYSGCITAAVRTIRIYRTINNFDKQTKSHIIHILYLIDFSTFIVWNVCAKPAQESATVLAINCKQWRKIKLRIDAKNPKPVDFVRRVPQQLSRIVQKTGAADNPLWQQMNAVGSEIQFTTS